MKCLSYLKIVFALSNEKQTPVKIRYNFSLETKYFVTCYLFNHFCTQKPPKFSLQTWISKSICLRQAMYTKQKLGVTNANLF